MSGMRKRCLVGMLSCFVGSSVANATVFTDVGAFNAAAPGLPVLDFEGIAPAGGSVFMSDFSAQGVTFSDATGGTSGVTVVDSAFFAPTFNTPSDYLAQTSNDASLVMHFNSPVAAAGFNVSMVFKIGEVTIEAFNGVASLESVTLTTTSPSDFTTFAGFSGIGNITEIQVTPGTSPPGDSFFALVDNLAFGVPEPASLSLLAVGTGAVLSVRRRRNSYQSR